MKYSDTKIQSDSNTTDLSANENYIKVIHKWSNLSFYDNNLNRTTPNISSDYYSDLYQFTRSAESIIKNNPDKTHIMLVFDIETISDINLSNNSLTGYESANNVERILKANIQEHNPYCRMNDETYAILLENHKSTDIAIMAIILTEELSNYNSDSVIKLTFGTCKADPTDYDIPYLYGRAFYAKNTIKGQNKPLLADYNELMFQKRVLC